MELKDRILKEMVMSPNSEEEINTLLDRHGKLTARSLIEEIEGKVERVSYQIGRAHV